MLTRRTILAAAPAVLRGATLTSPERVERALAGKDVDRAPFCLWHHFGLEKQGAAAHARKTLEFHRAAKTDFLKVMSDFPYPGADGKVHATPFPEQLKALEIIARDRPKGYHFVETLFNPWNVAEKALKAPTVKAMMDKEPAKLLSLLEAIAKSEANHARAALKIGASGIFLAIANAQDGILTEAEYAKFSEPFDRMVLDAAKGAPLNILHLHGPKVYVPHFLKGWDAVMHYSTHETGLAFARARAQFGGVLMGGVDQRPYRTMTVEQLKQQIAAASKEAGARFILAPGCSVPDDSTTAEVARLGAALGA